jgi:hypothetical protein
MPHSTRSIDIVLKCCKGIFYLGSTAIIRSWNKTFIRSNTAFLILQQIEVLTGAQKSRYIDVTLKDESHPAPFFRTSCSLTIFLMCCWSFKLLLPSIDMLYCCRRSAALASTTAALVFNLALPSLHIQTAV